MKPFKRLHSLKVRQRPLLSCASYGSRADDEEGTFLVVTREGSIRAFSASCSCLLHHFATLHATVISVHHSGHGDHIVTLERDLDGEDTFISVYHDWRGANFKGRGSVRAFTLPLASPDASIAVCPETGHVAVVDWSAAIVSFWHCTAGPFEHIAEMHLHIAPRAPRVAARMRREGRRCGNLVALYSDLLAVGSGSEAKLFHVPLHLESTAASSASSSASPVVEPTAATTAPATTSAAAATAAAAHVRCTFSAVDGQPLLLPPSLVVSLGGVPARAVGGGSGVAAAGGAAADIALEAASATALLHLYAPRLNATSGYSVGGAGTRLLLQRTFPPHRTVHSLTLVPAPESTGGAIMQLLVCTHRKAFLYALGVTRAAASGSASGATATDAGAGGRSSSNVQSRSHAWREMYGRIESVDPPQLVARYEFQAQLIDAAMAPRSDAPLLLYALTHKALEVWTRGGVLLCVHPLAASTPFPRAARSIALTVLSRYVVLLPLEAGEDLPPRRDAERLRRADTASTLRDELPGASMELRDALPSANGRDEALGAAKRGRGGVRSGADAGLFAGATIEIFHCASTVALCGGLLAHLASHKLGGRAPTSAAAGGTAAAPRAGGGSEGEGIAVLEEMFRALSASERAGNDELHFEITQRALLLRRRPSLADGEEVGADAKVQRLCRQLQAANRTAMRARVAGSVARLLLRPSRSAGAGEGESAGESAGAGAVDDDAAFRAAFYLCASDVHPDDALALLLPYRWALTAYVQVVLLPATEELVLPVAGVQVAPRVRAQSVRSAAFVKTALQHLRRAAPPSVLADIAIALSVVGDGAAVEFALRMLGEVARDAAARDGAAGVGGDEAEQRRRSLTTAPAGDFGPRAQLARAVLLLRQATIAGQHDSLGARDGKLRDARDALARVSPASLAGMCAATPRLLLEGLAFGSEKDAGEGGSGRTVDACAPFVRHLWNYSPVALVAALVAIVQQPRGAMGALGLVELSALDALALLRAVARGGDVDSGSMSSVRHQKNPGDAGSASISESDASAAESALHPAIIIFMERIADASSALSCTARGALALILAQHYMRCLATPPRGAAPRWSAPRWYTDSLPPSAAECPTWLARLALPEARAERNRSADTSDEMFSKLAVLVSTDARAASLEASVASAVLATANNFEHRSALRVLCMAELGDLDGSLHALLTIVRALRQRARTSILNDDALRDTCIAFVNERCSTLAHWRSVSAALFVAIVTAEREAKGAAHGEFCRGLYTTVLGQLVSNLSFASFASLLPENGSLAFYLPFLERSVARNVSERCRQALLSSAPSLDV